MTQTTRRVFLEELIKDSVGMLGIGVVSGCGLKIPNQDISLTVEQNPTSTNFESLNFLRDLAQSQNYSYEQFLDEIRRSVESEDISAFIFGETHSVPSQMELAYQVMRIIQSSSKKIVRFFDEMVNWGNEKPYKQDRGVFADDFGDKKDLMVKTDGLITHVLNIPYVVLYPLRLQEISNLVRKLSQNEIVVTYTGNPHADSIFKSYLLSLDMPNQLAGIPIAEYPTVSQEVQKLGVKRISLMMYQLQDLKDYSEKGFEKEISNQNKSLAWGRFKSEQRSLLNNIQPRRVYRIRPNVYIQITNDTLPKNSHNGFNQPVKHELQSQ